MYTQTPPSMATRFSERKRVVRDDDDDDYEISEHINGPPLKINVKLRSAERSAFNSVQNDHNVQNDNYLTPKTESSDKTQMGKRKTFEFAETTDEILAKYSDQSPSIEFHIHKNHFRFGNQDGVIAKNNPIIKTFLESMLREELPAAASEVLKEAGVIFYDGCIIVKVIDHRHAQARKGHSENAPPNQNGSANNDNTNNTNNSNNKSINNTESKSTNNQENNSTSPNAEESEDDSDSQVKSYRTLLRPTPLSLWNDLLCMTDLNNNLLTEPLATYLESEILNFTYRNVDMTVPLNPYKYPELPLERPYPTIEELKAKGIPIQESSLHLYRQECEKEPRQLHEDLPQNNSEYEELMLIMDDHHASTTATDTSSGQFLRLGFIEQWRKKRERYKMQTRQAQIQTRQAQIQQQQQQQQQQRLMQMHQQQLQNQIKSKIMMQQQQQQQFQPSQQQQNGMMRSDSPQSYRAGSIDQGSPVMNGMVNSRGSTPGGSINGGSRESKSQINKRRYNKVKKERISGKTLPGHSPKAGKSLPGYGNKGIPITNNSKTTKRKSNTKR